MQEQSKQQRKGKKQEKKYEGEKGGEKRRKKANHCTYDYEAKKATNEGSREEAGGDRSSQKRINARNQMKQREKMETRAAGERRRQVHGRGRERKEGQQGTDNVGRRCAGLAMATCKEKKRKGKENERVRDGTQASAHLQNIGKKRK